MAAKINKSPRKGGISPQAALVLDYLSGGRELTPLIAHMTLGVASLTSRIAELRKLKNPDGSYTYPGIKDEWRNDHFNRRYKAYWMGKAEASSGAGN
jgi:hypothetical protein